MVDFPNSYGAHRFQDALDSVLHGAPIQSVLTPPSSDEAGIVFYDDITVTPDGEVIYWTSPKGISHQAMLVHQDDDE